jgi:SAM-dependent methyltransferase
MPRATTTEPKSKLLPSEIGDFRSKGFWQQFFEARGGKAFEWYGAWVNFAPNFFALTPDTSARILVVGCGNSGMSAQLYAAGYTNVTNVDFDAGVIEEMRRKHAEKCPKMQWRVMDVTAMHDLGDGAFDVVLDKGTMDAMFTDASADVLASIDGMLGEVRRLLAPGGLYLIVTLAQEHLLRHWATRMAAASTDGGTPSAAACAAVAAPGWSHVHVDTFSIADLSSNRCQFVLTARKPGLSAGADAATPIASGAAAAAPAPRIIVHSPHSFEDAAPPAALLKKSSGAATGSGAASGAAKGGKKGAGPAAGGAGGASTPVAPAAAAGEWVCVHASGEEIVSVDFAPLPAGDFGAPAAPAATVAPLTAGGLPSDAPAPAAAAVTAAAATAAAAAGVERLLAEVGEVQWAYSTARALSSVHPDNYLSVDVWPMSALSAVAGGGAGRAAGGLVMVTPAGVKPKLLRDEGEASAMTSRAAPATAAPSPSAGSAVTPAPQQLLQLQHQFPRFTITVVDVSLAPSAAVVLIPQGREHEWLFASREGQRQVAASARAYGRVIFVALGRGHAFPGGPKAVQEELTPTIVRFLPPALRPSTGSGKGGRSGGGAASVPYLAVADDIGSRQVVAQGSSALSGGYVVEDVEVEPEEGEAEDAAVAEEEEAGAEAGLDAAGGAGAGAAEAAGSPSAAGAAANANVTKSKGKPGKAAPPAAKRPPPLHLRRRLVFLSNRNAVQSEAYLRIPAAAAASLAAVKGVDEQIAHASAAAVVDASHLCFEYQQAMSAVVRLYCRSSAGSGGSAAAGAAAEPLRVCVVGLGSGALASFLAAQTPAAISAASGGRFSRVDVTAVELDGEVVALAQRHFGFRASAVDGEGAVSAEVAHAAAGRSVEGAQENRVRVMVGDGLTHLQAFGTGDATAPAAAPASGSTSTAAVAVSATTASSGDALPPQPYHVLIIDVDAKDLATAISFPPPAFLARQALAHMRAAVTRQQQVGESGSTAAATTAASAAAAPAPGLVLINFSCRSAPLKKAILASLQRAFAATVAATAAAGGSAASAGSNATVPAAAGADAGVVLEVSLESAVPDASNSLIAATTSPALAAALAGAAATAGAGAATPASGGGRAAGFWQRYEREWAPLVNRVPAA